MPLYQHLFLKIIGVTAISCFYVIALALCWFLLDTPLAILVTVLSSLVPLRYIRRYLNAQGRLKDRLNNWDDSWFFGALSLILLVIGGNNSADLGWFLAGGVTLGVALARRPAQPAPVETVVQAEPLPYHVNRLPLLIGAIIMFGVAEISGQRFNIAPLAQVSTTLQFIGLIVAILLITWGIIGNTPLLAQPAYDWREIGLVGAIALIGFLLRIYHLQGAQRFVIDEILFIKPVIMTWDHQAVPLFAPFSTIASFPLIYPYLQSWSVELLGANLAGIRFVSVVFGTLGIIALYWLSRALFGRRIALSSAFLLAVLPIHIQFSRIGINNIADPLFGTLALYFIVQAIRHPERMMPYLGLAGIFTGLTQYWYDGGRFIFLALSVLLLGALLSVKILQAIRTRQNQALFSTLKACLMFAIGLVLIAFPVYYTLDALDKPLSSRFNRVGVTESHYGDEVLLAQHIETNLPLIYHFHFTQPESDFYYAGDDPLIPRHNIPLFIGGFVVGLALLFKRKPAGLLIVLWLGLTWAGNLFLQTPDISARYVVELPLVALLIALGLDTFATLILRRRKLIISAVIAVCAIFSVVQIHHYFGAHMERFNYQVRHVQAGRNRDVDDLLFRVVDFPASTQVYILDNAPFPSSDLDNLLRFYRGVKTGWKYTVYVMPPVDAIETSYLQNLSRDVDYVFFVSIVHPVDMDNLILSLYPDLQGPFYTSHQPSMSSQYVMYILPANSP